MTEGRPVPGDARPRTLTRPPGDRYASGTAASEPTTSPHAERGVAVRPNLGRAGLWGLGAAIAIAALIAVLVGILDIDAGLIAVAAIGGWAIAAATRAGAWSNAVALPSPWVRVLAIALALGAWLVGYIGAYLISLLLRPDSSLTFGQRVAQSPFLDWLSPQFGPLQIVELLLLGGIAWYSSRSGTRPSDA